MTDYMVSANEARDLLDGYETLKSSPECSGACARAAAPELARTVVALHERVAAVEAERDRLRAALRAATDRVAAAEAERDGALAQCEELTAALRATQRARDAAAQAFDDLVATVWRAATGDEHEPPGSTGALVEAVQALREAQRERDALRARLAGRTTPPTDEEIAAHARRAQDRETAGLWLVGGELWQMGFDAAGSLWLRRPWGEEAAGDWARTLIRRAAGFRWLPVHRSDVVDWPGVPRG